MYSPNDTTIPNIVKRSSTLATKSDFVSARPTNRKVDPTNIRYPVGKDLTLLFERSFFSFTNWIFPRIPTSIQWYLSYIYRVTEFTTILSNVSLIFRNKHFRRRRSQQKILGTRARDKLYNQMQQNVLSSALEKIRAEVRQVVEVGSLQTRYTAVRGLSRAPAV